MTSLPAKDRSLQIMLLECLDIAESSASPSAVDAIEMLELYSCDDGDRRVTVCDQCCSACCWQGEFMCDGAKTAGTVEKTVRELLGLALEHPDFWVTR